MAPKRPRATTWRTQLDTLASRLDTLELKDNDDLIQDEERGQSPEKNLRNTLFEICQVVHRAKAANDPELEPIMNRADDLINRGIGLAYGSTYEIDFLESFGDMPGTLVKDSLKGFDTVGSSGRCSCAGVLTSAV